MLCGVVEHDTVREEFAVLGGDDATLRVCPRGLLNEARGDEGCRGVDKGKLHVTFLYHGRAVNLTLLREADRLPVPEVVVVEVEGSEIRNLADDSVTGPLLLGVDVVVVAKETTAWRDSGILSIHLLLHQPLALGEGVGIKVPADELPVLLAG